MNDAVIWLADAGQAAVPLLSLAAYLPQWIKICRTRTSGSISIRAWLIWTLSSVLALFYAVVQLLLNGRGWALVFATGAGLAFVVTTLLLVIWFRPSVPGAVRTYRS